MIRLKTNMFTSKSLFQCMQIHRTLNYMCAKKLVVAQENVPKFDKINIVKTGLTTFFQEINYLKNRDNSVIEEE